MIAGVESVEMCGGSVVGVSVAGCGESVCIMRPV